MPGRKAKPAAVKKALGNPGRRPIVEHELPDTGEVRMPEFVSKDPRAVELWNEYAPALLTIGSLRKESERLFARWCMEQALYERNPKKFTASRLTGLRAMESMLGMDPSNRAKFGTPKSDTNEDPAEAFFSGPRLVG